VQPHLCNLQWIFNSMLAARRWEVRQLPSATSYWFPSSLLQASDPRYVWCSPARWRPLTGIVQQTGESKQQPRITPMSWSWTQYRSFRRQSSQPITWLILTNKTVQENTVKQTQYKSEKSKQPKIQQNKTTLVQLPLTMLGQETRWAYSTMLPSPHGAIMPVSQLK